jgi:CubicO group peptidase (beta-lactamase class C family)
MALYARTTWIASDKKRYTFKSLRKGVDPMSHARHFMTVVCLLLAMQLQAAEDPVPANPVDTVEELDARIATILEETGAPGMIGAIVYGNEVIWRGALGMANLDFEQPVTPDTLFRVGSISKSIVSLSILKLVERGEISLDDLISDLAPETGVVNPWEESDPVRLVHTLEHTAGFDDIHFRDFAFSDPNVTTLEGIEFNNNSSNVRWRPGTRMSYSNIGPAIAAVALENVTGMTFENFAKQEIFDPLGMSTASFFFAEGVASSYNPNNEVSSYIHIPVRPSGAMNATSTDMAQLLKMFIGRGSLGSFQLIQPDSLARMETPTTTVGAEQGLSTGYGLSNYTTLRNGFVLHGHNGGIDGFSSSYAYLPEAERGYFYSVNQPNGPAIRQIGALISDFITQDLTPPDPLPVVELSDSELAAFAGYYESDSPRIELLAGVQRLTFTTVRTENGKLFINPLIGDETELLPVGNKQFRRDEDAIATYAFVTSPDGENLLQLNQGTLKKIGPIKAYGRLLAILYAVIMLASSLIFALYWLALKLKPKHLRPPTPCLSVRSMPAAASATFALFIFLTANLLSSSSVAELTPLTVSFWLLSMLFPVMTGLAIYAVTKQFVNRREVGIAVWHHSLHTAIGMAIIVIFLFSFGFVGLQTWAY